MAMGTIASRLTGFVRSAILIYAIGTQDLGNAYNLANTIPNIVYNLALGGILTSVVVPLLVNAAKRDRDRGEAYDQRIFTLGVLALGGITVVATLAAEPIASLYAGNIGSPAAYHLTVIFAYFFIPQIFFYGVSSLAGAILNARGSFAAPMWTPVINNVVVILVGLAFMATAGLNRTPRTSRPARSSCWASAPRWASSCRPRRWCRRCAASGSAGAPGIDFRRAEVSEIGRMSGWMFGYVLTTQIAFLVTTRVANAAGARVPQSRAGRGGRDRRLQQRLHAVPAAVRDRRHLGDHRAAAEDERARVRAPVPARLGGLLHRRAARLGHRGARRADPRRAGHAAGRGGVRVRQHLDRRAPATWARSSRCSRSACSRSRCSSCSCGSSTRLHDSRTPALISVVTMAINITANLMALAVLPPQHVVAGLGAGFGLASLVGRVIAWRVLQPAHRRPGRPPGRAPRCCG